jgi:alpha-tubulin suppressor-like RCC1 family protein
MGFKIRVLFILSFSVIWFSSCDDDKSSESVCGNQIVEVDEMCDGTALGGVTCMGIGFTSGVPVCNTICNFDFDGCSDEPECGNGIVDGSETCDGSPVDCKQLGYESGEAPCTDGCYYDVSDCEPNGAPFNSSASTISSSSSSTCSIDDSNSVSCWGNNQLGTLGVEPHRHLYSPMKILGNHRFTSLAVTIHHTCGIDEGGSTWCFGSNSYGQLGLTEFPDFMTPTEGLHFPSPLNPFIGRGVSISTAYGQKGCSNTTDHTCLVNESGQAWCFGDNTDRVLGSSVESGSSIPLKVNSSEQFIEISTAGHHTCALDDLGHAWCWGQTINGILGREMDPDLGLTGSATPVPVLLDLTFESINTGGRNGGNSCGVTVDGTGYCWGDNSFGSLGGAVVSSYSATPVKVLISSPLIQIATGGSTACALTESGELYCWGDVAYLPGVTVTESSTPLLVHDSTIPPLGSISIGEPEAVYATTQSGELWRFGKINGTEELLMVDDTYNWVSVTSASTSWCATNSDGDSYCGGSNSYGHLGQLLLSTIPARYPYQDQISSFYTGESRARSWIDTSGNAFITTDGTPLPIEHSTKIKDIRYEGSFAWFIDDNGDAFYLNPIESMDILPIIHPLGLGFLSLSGSYPYLLDSQGEVWFYDGEGVVSPFTNMRFTMFEFPCGLDFNQRAFCMTDESWMELDGIDTFTPSKMACHESRCCFSSDEGVGVKCYKNGVFEQRLFEIGGFLSLGNGFLCGSLSENGCPKCVSLDMGSNYQGELGNGTYQDSFSPSLTISFDQLLTRYNLNLD